MAAQVPAQKLRAALRGLVGVALGLCTLAGAQAAPVGVNATDDRGRAIELREPARRVITLAPHATELVYAAGGGASLVGTIDYSDYPPEARTLPRVGDAWHLHPERVLSLRPDLLVAWLPGPLAALQPILAASNIAVFHAAPDSLAGIADTIEQLARVLGTEAVGLPVAQAMRERLARLQERYAARPPLRVFVQAGSEPLYTLNDRHIVGDVLRLCGAHNVFGDAPAAAPMVELEAVIAARPDVFVVARDHPGHDPAATWQRYAASLPAVQAGRIVTLSADELYRPGPRLLEAAEALCTALDAMRD